MKTATAKLPKKPLKKVNHDARRWAVLGIRFPGPYEEVWWNSTGFTKDEETCGLYTKAKAEQILNWLTSPEGIVSRLSDYAYDIKRVR